MRVLFRTFVRFLDDVTTINTKCPGFSPAEDVEVHDRLILLPYASSRRRKSNIMGSLALTPGLCTSCWVGHGWERGKWNCVVLYGHVRQ